MSWGRFVKVAPLVLGVQLLVLLGVFRLEAAEVVLKVGLGSPPAPQFPELGRRFWVVSGNRRKLLRGPLAIRSVPPKGAAQVGVFFRSENATALASEIRGLGLPVVLVQENGRIRVLVRPAPGQSREELQRQLQAHGYHPFWVVLQPAVATVSGGEGGEVSGERVQVVPLEAQPVAVGAAQFRGEFLCLGGEKGPEIINLVPLEAYLLGVVPAEMSFPHLEALKAQAVAARTYALVSLGRHRQEGFDLCSGEHCQVYRGVPVEEALATRAVVETQGLVLTFGGQLAATYFHSTCGGHTEAAENVFSSASIPYLQGVPCRGETVRLGQGTPGPFLSSQEGLRLVALRLAQAVNARWPLAFAQALGNGSGETVEEALGLADFAPLFGPGVDFQQILHRFHLAVPESPDAWAGTLRRAQLAGRVKAHQGLLIPGEEGPRWRSTAGEGERPVAGLAVIWQDGARYWEGSGETGAGSPAVLWCAGEVCPLVVVQVSREADARSRWQTWVREFPAGELAARLKMEALREVRVLQRTGSGRVAQVEVRGSGAPSQFSGPDLRRLLGLPSTWFVLSQLGQAQKLVFRFYGKGWGHGVGLCQNGAYGLALGGWDYARILAWYYPGTQVETYRSALGRTQP